MRINNRLAMNAFFPKRLILAGLVFAIWQNSVTAQELPQASSLASLELMVQLGQKGNVLSAAPSPDGRLVLSGGEDYSVVLWDLETGREVRRFRGHRDVVTAVAFSTTGQYALSGSEDGTIRVWNASTGAEIRRFVPEAETGGTARFLNRAFGGPSDYPVHSVATDSNGRYVAAGTEDGIFLWEFQTGTFLHRVERRGRIGRYRVPITAVTFSPDGRRLLSCAGESNLARLWDAASGRSIDVFEGHETPVTSVAFSSDGRLIAGASEDGTVLLWEVASGRVASRFGHDAEVHAVAFSPDGSQVLSGSADGMVHLWDAAGGARVREFWSGGSAVTSLEFSQDGRYAFGSFAGGHVLGWDVSKGQPAQVFFGDAPVPTAMRLGHDGQSLFVGVGGEIALWDLTLGQPVRRFPGQATLVSDLAFGSTGAYLLGSAYDQQNVHVWDVATGQVQGVFTGHSDEVAAVDISGDERFGLSGSEDGMVSLWSILTGATIQTVQVPSAVTSIAFSPDGLHAAIGSVDGVRLWTLGSGSLGRPFRRNNEEQFSLLTAVAFAPNSNGRYLAAGSLHGDVRLWDVQTGLEVRALEATVDEWVESIAFGPDGRYLYVGRESGIIQMWDVQEEAEVHRFEGHTYRVVDLAASPDGNWLYSASNDGTVRIWDVRQRAHLARLVHFRDADGWVVATPHGRFDTNDLAQIDKLHWIASDDPMKPLSLEIFMRDYYEPRLLSRLRDGEELPPIRDLSRLNRVQPRVEITRIEPVSNVPDQVRVTVAIENIGGTRRRLTRDSVGASGVYDLRLFRDGRLIAQWPEPTDVPIGSITTDVARRAWQEASRIALDITGRADTTFTVRLPHPAAPKEVEFSAYAFNSDRVKSASARQPYTIPAGRTAAARRAYIVSVGVTTTTDPYWSLDFAKEDARIFRTQLTDALRQTGAYSEVVPVTIVNRPVAPFAEDGAENYVEPTKANIRTVLDLLAGRGVAASRLDQIPDGVRDRLRRAEPEDLVLLSVSAHGVVDPASGLLYVLPRDIGTGSSGRVTEALKRRAISSEELSLWLREVDAQIAVVLGTCYSEDAVSGGGFKPGPFGDRGLGQLSFDKGATVLVSSQSAAWEASGSGLLTYALAEEGLGRRMAAGPDGKITLVGAFAYAAERVPGLFAERIDAGGDVQQPMPDVQQPILFDFRSGNVDVLLTGSN